MRRRTKHTICVLASLGLMLWPALTNQAQSRRFKVKRAAAPFTSRLPAIDKVELLKFKVREIAIEGILESKTIEGAQAQQIARLWRVQEFDTEEAICHYPVYGIKFYMKGKVRAYVSICWECHNIEFLEPKVGIAQGFAADRRKGQELLKVFTDAFPER